MATYLSLPTARQSDLTNTPFKEQLKILMWVILILVPLLLDEGLEFRKEFFNWIKIWRIRRQVQEFNTCFSTHPLNPFGAVKRRIVHDQHRPWLRVWLAVVKELFNKVLEDSTISRSLEHTR